jgi:hypothetical protein
VVAGISGVSDETLLGALTEIESLSETLLNGKVLIHGIVRNNKSLEFNLRF